MLGVLVLYFWLGALAALLLLPAFLLHDETIAHAPMAATPMGWTGLPLTLVLLVFPLVLLWRAGSRRTTLSGDAFVHRTTFTTWCTALTQVRTVSQDVDDLTLRLDDGLPANSSAERAPRVPTKQLTYSSRSPVLLVALGLVAFSAALSTMLAFDVLAVSRADDARTDVGEANVERTDVVDGDSRIVVLLPVADRLVRVLLWREGRTKLHVEEAVHVRYDPHDVGNVEFAERADVDAGGAWILLLVSLVVCLASVLGTIGITVDRWAAYRRVRRRIAHGARPPRIRDPSGMLHAAFRRGI